MSVWIPTDVATPTKDGARFLGWVRWLDGPCSEVVTWKDGRFWRDAFGGPCATVSHWMPLPDGPPADAQ